ncbi:MAG: DUF4097 domain-containing protein [Ignavibacteria bacterium]|nr:DUF4097 domain-containing protein [Ignavibacteria bacterium]
MKSIALFVSILCFPLALFGGEKKFEKKFDVDSGGRLVVKTDFGDVSVKGTSSDVVSINALIRGSMSDLDEFEVTADQSGNTVEVRGKGPKSDSWWSSGLDNMSVRIMIEVPERFNIDVSTAGGDVTVDRIEGAVEAGTSGGDVTVRGIRGEVSVGTSGGDIVAEELTGNLKGSTSGGDIRVAQLSGNAGVETSGGDIRISGVGGSVRAETSGGDIVVLLTGTNKGVMAETSGGDIEIRAAKGIAANLDASTSGGSVVCNLPILLVGEIDESEVRGTINGGGEMIRARTSGGDIRIRQAD